MVGYKIEVNRKEGKFSGLYDGCCGGSGGK